MTPLAEWFWPSISSTSQSGHTTYPIKQVDLIINSLFVCKKLQKNDAKTVDIGLLVQSGGLCVFGINVSNCAQHMSGGVCSCWLNVLSNPKICQMRLHAAIEQDVARFHVTMNDLWFTIFVKVRESLRSSWSNPEPGVPIKFLLHMA